LIRYGCSHVYKNVLVVLAVATALLNRKRVLGRYTHLLNRFSRVKFPTRPSKTTYIRMSPNYLLSYLRRILKFLALNRVRALRSSLGFGTGLSRRLPHSTIRSYRFFRVIRMLRPLRLKVNAKRSGLLPRYSREKHGRFKSKR